MEQNMIWFFLAFLEYLVKTELSPVTNLPHNFVTFTIPELRSALREMKTNSELFLRFMRETETQKTDVENIVAQYPELAKYADGDVDLDRTPDDVPSNKLGRFEIIFEVAGHRYYCFADAVNMNEALGQFFRSHPNLTYNNIFEHIDI